MADLSAGSLDSAGEFNACRSRSVALSLPSLPPSSLLPALRTFPSLAYQSANGIASFTAAALHLDSVLGSE